MVFKINKNGSAVLVIVAIIVALVLAVLVFFVLFGRGGNESKNEIKNGAENDTFVVSNISYYNTNSSKLSNVIKEKDMTLERMMSIVQKDKDYPEFIKLNPRFEPQLEGIAPFDEGVEEILKDQLKDLGTYDSLKADKNVYVLRFGDKNNPNKSLLAVVDVVQNKSLLIIDQIKVEVGV